MSGIDRSLIVNMSEEDVDEYTCGICYEIFVNPMVTPCCRQTYCKDCITQWLSGGGQSCPNDREPLLIDSLSAAPRSMINFLNNIRVKCKFNENGCQSVIKLSEMEKHSEVCEHNQCDICGIGRESDVGHNCIQNLKVKIESISAENKRLTVENQRLKQDLILREDTNSNRTDFLSITGIDSMNGSHRSKGPRRGSQTRGGHTVRFGRLMAGYRPQQRRVLSDKLEHFIKGKFRLESKFKLEENDNKIENKFLETFFEVDVNANSFTFKRVQKGDDPIIKQFTLGELFRWVRSDGKPFRSTIEYRPNLLVESSCRLIETMYDHGKVTEYQYDFNILTNSLTIEWTVAKLTKVEIFIKIV